MPDRETPTNPQIKRGVRLSTVALGIVLLLILVGSVACNSQAQQPKAAAPPPPTVEIITVTPQDTAIFTEHPANTYARDAVEVLGRLTDYIGQWVFDPGEHG